MASTAVHNFEMGQGEEKSTGKQAPHSWMVPLATDDFVHQEGSPPPNC